MHFCLHFDRLNSLVIEESMYIKSNTIANWPLIKRSAKSIFDVIIIRTPFLSFKSDDKPAVVLEDHEESDVYKCIGVLSEKTSMGFILFQDDLTGQFC